MPIVSLENVGQLSKEAKAELIERLTEIVVDITKKPKEYVYIKINEIPRENFGIGGKSLG